MEQLIAGFGQQLRDAIAIANAARISPKQEDIRSILVIGMGGSAFGGEIVKGYIAQSCKAPFAISREYRIPAWVGPHTLVIASSYSGNTEETLASLEQAEAQGAEIAAITSGGKLLDIAREKGYNHIIVPGGSPPRTAAGYSIVQQLRILHGYGLIPDFFADLEEGVKLVENFSDKEAAQSLAQVLANTIPVMYSAPELEAISIRWRQQFAENSKNLGWHHVVPEMNHNELVGWVYPKEAMDKVYAVFLEREEDHPRIRLRSKLTRELIREATRNVCTVAAKGENLLAQMLYLLHYGDWVSLYLAFENDADPIQIKSIDHLKTELAKVD
jgi:glucose/mannose-6-phosphate isomerase